MGGPTVLLTGATGTIGTALRDRLPAAGWDVRALDRRAAPGVLVADVTDPAALAAALAPDAAGTPLHAVVHLAGQPTEAPWPVIREANLDGTLQVLEAARRHGVRRVVLASSNHAVGFVPVPGAGEPPLPADTAARPDTLYGVSKVFAEALGRYYADRYGLQVACLRIGTFAPRPVDRRSLGTWLSPDDCGRLVDACLRSQNLGWALVWGISRNTRRTWSLAAGEALGYHPRDDAERFADDVPDGPAFASDAFVGGGFTSEGFGLDEVAARWEHR